MVLTAVTTAEVVGAEARELSDDDVLAVLTKEAKKRAKRPTPTAMRAELTGPNAR